MLFECCGKTIELGRVISFGPDIQIGPDGLDFKVELDGGFDFYIPALHRKRFVESMKLLHETKNIVPNPMYAEKERIEKREAFRKKLFGRNGLILFLLSKVKFLPISDQVKVAEMCDDVKRLFQELPR